MSSQSSTANQEEMRAKKGKASMTETKLPKPKEEGNKGKEIMKKAAKTPLSLKDLSTLNICRTRRVKKEARATKKKIPKLPKVEMEPPPPSSSSTTPQPNTPLEPSEKDPTLAQSSSLPVAPSRFTKVTDWKTMQSFQYELHLEHETFLEQREARHYELLEEMMPISSGSVLCPLRLSCVSREYDRDNQIESKGGLCLILYSLTYRKPYSRTPDYASNKYSDAKKNGT
nr:hypothetical protein Iba_chr03bCG5150 [Ipomoea batatas]